MFIAHIRKPIFFYVEICQVIFPSIMVMLNANFVLVNHVLSALFSLLTFVATMILNLEIV